jgi:outer membrane protein TolC
MHKLTIAVFASTSLLFAQIGRAPSTQSQSATSPRTPAPPSPAVTSATSSITASVPSGTATGTTIDLTLHDAVERALQYNLALVEGGQNVRLTRSARLAALAQLLPSIEARPSVSEEQINLAALGFPGLPGVPAVVGPFKVFDFRGNANEALGFAGIRGWQAQNHAVRAAELTLRDARDEVVRIVIQLYLQAIAGSARIDAMRAQVQTATELFRTASDQRAAGVAPAIDVLRAQVELQGRQQQLIYYEGEFEKQKLALARAIGLPMAQQFRLAEDVPYNPLPAGFDLNAALGEALRNRADFQAAEAAVRSAELTKSASRAQWYPALVLHADYGANGLDVDRLHGSFTLSAGVSIPIFESGRIKAAVEEADAALEQRRARRDSLRADIEAQVRSAFIDVQSAARQVEVARSSVDLANQEQVQARDRFAAGVTNNLEVVQAQEAVAAANDNYINALLAFNSAKAALARARGITAEAIATAVTGK